MKNSGLEAVFASGQSSMFIIIIMTCDNVYL